MPYRNIATLHEWLDEFERLGFSVGDSLRVIEQDGDQGEDPGLVTLRLRRATTSVYIQPVSVGSARWSVTFEARDEPVEMTAAGVAGLAADLGVVSALCAFLEAKSSAIVSGS